MGYCLFCVYVWLPLVHSTNEWHCAATKYHRVHSKPPVSHWCQHAEGLHHTTMLLASGQWTSDTGTHAIAMCHYFEKRGTQKCQILFLALSIFSSTEIGKAFRICLLRYMPSPAAAAFGCDAPSNARRQTAVSNRCAVLSFEGWIRKNDKLTENGAINNKFIKR